MTETACCDESLLLTRRVPFPTGILLACIPSRFHFLGLVVCSLGQPWWRQLLWCIGQFMDSRHDVLVLHLGAAQDCVPLETVPDTGTIGAIHFCRGLHDFLLHQATCWNLDHALRGPTVRNGQSLGTFLALLPKGIPKQARKQTDQSCGSSCCCIGICKGCRSRRCRSGR